MNLKLLQINEYVQVAVSVNLSVFIIYSVLVFATIQNIYVDFVFEMLTFFMVSEYTTPKT